jgi:hypothetical protein
MPKTQEIVYALVGVGDFAAEKVRGVRTIADRKATQKVYKDFVKRGRGLSKKVGSSAPTKHAVAQTRAARAQVKAATTSVRKAVRLDARAAGSAVRKTAKAS